VRGTKEFAETRYHVWTALRAAADTPSAMH
jgi:hypothetical protein